MRTTVWRRSHHAVVSFHGVPCSRALTVEGVDSDGQPCVHHFTLHEESLLGYTTRHGDMQGCITTCRSFARELIYNIELRLGDLTCLNEAKLFMPPTWPRGVEARDTDCKTHLHGLIHLFQARERQAILPGVEKKAARAELHTLLPVLASAPKEAQTFMPACRPSWGQATGFTANPTSSDYGLQWLCFPSAQSSANASSPARM
ncbi:unnamed protein product [Closterium sp. NIES-54]